MSMPENFVTSSSFDENVKRFADILSESVRVRVANLPAPSVHFTHNSTPSRLGRYYFVSLLFDLCSYLLYLYFLFPFVGILFSGGLDSMVLAALASRHIPQQESIDLINVAFGDTENSEFDKVPDRQNSINGYISFHLVY